MQEPDLQVLAEQVPAIPNKILILSVAAGVGLFLMIAQIRIFFHIPLAKMLWVFYPLVFLLAFLAPDSFIPVSFDSGGVTTGPVTVPFIMALGIGLATLRSDKKSREDSFGLISLCSIGPILAVLLLGIFYEPDQALYSPTGGACGGNNEGCGAAVYACDSRIFQGGCGGTDSHCGSICAVSDAVSAV